MSSFLKRAAVIAAIAFAFVSPARASGVSDLWWNASESGWGVNVVGQSDTLFLTFFVYGQTGSRYESSMQFTVSFSGTTMQVAIDHKGAHS